MGRKAQHKNGLKRVRASDTEKSDRERVRLKTRRVANLVERFLEEDLKEEELAQNPARIDELKALLEKDLWGKKISPYDPDWNFESELSDPDNPGLYGHEEIDADMTSVGANTILFFHRLLKDGFWEKFKTEMMHFQYEVLPERKRIKDIEAAGAALKGIEIGPVKGEDFAEEYLDQVHMERESFLLINLPAELNAHCSFETEKVLFFRSGIDAIHALMGLFQGLPIEIFKKCKECGRVFVLTSKHKREFCNQRCAARYGARQYREQCSDDYRTYHKDYYHKKLSKAAREEQSGS
jgi:hypothetical protein